MVKVKVKIIFYKQLTVTLNDPRGCHLQKLPDSVEEWSPGFLFSVSGLAPLLEGYIELQSSICLGQIILTVSGLKMQNKMFLFSTTNFEWEIIVFAEGVETVTGVFVCSQYN